MLETTTNFDSELYLVAFVIQSCIYINHDARFVLPFNSNNWGCIQIITGLLLITEGGCLFFGAIHSSKVAIVVYLTLRALTTVIQTIYAVLFLLSGIHGTTVAYYFFGQFLFAAVVSSYFWLCVLSFRNALKCQETEVACLEEELEDV